MNRECIPVRKKESNVGWRHSQSMYVYIAELTVTSSVQNLIG